MKKIFTTLALSLGLLAGTANAQKDFHQHERKINWQQLLQPKSSLAIGFSSVSEARSIISDIMSAVNVQQNFKVMSTTQVGNAAAMTYQGQRYILYNPSFINDLDRVANDKWASISVLAHEIGHHALNHTIGEGGNSSHARELAADEFSGLVMAKMGASLKQAQLAMSLISDPQGSASHPGEAQRLAAIAKGYTNGGGVNTDIASNYPSNGGSTRTYPQDIPSTRQYPQQYPQDRTVNQYPQQQQQRRNRTMGGRNAQAQNTITHQIRFNNGLQYYITQDDRVVALRNNNYKLVARLSQTNDRNYPYIMYDDQTQFYVDGRGIIYTDKGQRIGAITEV
jgi:hypothetical protein